ncbi:MAG: aldehyde ferredoxin oxidoreductase C-terminal domain-containing protein [Thermodesulfobacteriota bacterium]|nr:aldehyde ferredoxin oxidoreductase C-terminal domain-containing protein [Thermodesulfobacteriota bacterium]
MLQHFSDTMIAFESYELAKVHRGYTDRTLKIDISTYTFEIKPVPHVMKEKFIGGKGFDLYLLWNAVSGDTTWKSPENEICIAAGPLGGTPIYPGSGKSIITTISPLTGSVIDSNVGGYFGPYLKFAGFDALEIQGKAEEEVVILIDGLNGTLTIERPPEDLSDQAYEITDYYHKRVGKEHPRDVSVVCSGTAARHSFFGCLNVSWYDPARQSVRIKQAGRGGIGTVFSHKKIKALVVKSPKVTVELNDPADKETLKRVGRAHSTEIREVDPQQNEMSTIGTTHLVTIMDDYDLLPTHNFKFGSHKDAWKMGREEFRKRFNPGFDGCWLGCAVACSHCVKDFELTTGPKKGKKVLVDGPEYETIAGCGSNCGIFDADHVIEMNYWCDTYGLDTISMGTAIAFAMECYENGIINSEHTGGLELTFGNKEVMLELIHQIALGEGFGLIVGMGVRQMKEIFHKEYGADCDFMDDIGMEAKGLEFSQYMSKESLAQQGGYGLALKGPQHDEAWLIFLDMVQNYMPTFEEKAEALHWFPMLRTWFGLCGLCKLPWNDVQPADNKDTPEPAKVMKHVEWYSEYFTAVTGRPIDPDDMIKMSEVVYNFQRIFNLKMGFGRRDDDKIPYRAMGPVTEDEYLSREERYDNQLKEVLNIEPSAVSLAEKMKSLREYREKRYEGLMDAVYKRRGWTKDGIPTLEKVKELGIDFPDVVELLLSHKGL